MTFETLMKDLEAGKYKPVYLLQGDEDYYIDQAVSFFEHRLLTEAERDFNLNVFYGKDADWTELLNACRRYPMFSEKQVVLLKEAQSMRKQDLGRLEGYLADPLDTTIFVMAYKGGKIDGRTKMSSLIKKKGEILSVRKVYENKLPTWIRTFVASKGYDITEKACMMLASHIGLDLSVQANEINKIFINLPDKSTIDDVAVESYVGISREYNVFEFQNALGRKDVPRLIRIIQYFSGNPKAAPLTLLLPLLHRYFSNIGLMLQLKGKSKKELADALGVNPFFLSEYQQAARNYGKSGTERALLLLHEYNLRKLGIHNGRTNEAGLLKELTVKILN